MFKQYINGKIIEGLSGEQSIINPATEKVAGTLRKASAAQAAEALLAARAAFKAWSKLSLNERGAWMLKLADAIEAEKETVLDILMSETGKPLDNADYDFNMVLDCLRYYIEEAKRLSDTIIPDYGGNFRNLVIRQPLGVVVGYLAWNFPLLNLGYKLGPALASGCTCVIKPSSRTPLATLYIGEIAAKIGFPAGVINIVAGAASEISETLNTSVIPKMITLIGSSQTGRDIIKQSATSVKHYSLELGGNAPAIVMPDYDPDDAAMMLVGLKFGNCGQVCVSPNRVFIHKDIYGEFIKAAVKYASEITLGWGREANAGMGPMIDGGDRERVIGLIADAVQKGAKVLCGGKIPEDKKAGFYFPPTVIGGVTPDMRVYREEIFGPVMPCMTFETAEEVLAAANDTEYGLASYLFTNDLNAAFDIAEGLEFGSVCVNEPYYNYNLPHGGTKESGIGKDCSTYSLEEYYYLKRISIRR